MDLIKEAEKDAIEEEKEIKRINAMTDEEYEAYVDESFEEAEKELERGEKGIPYETVMERIKKELEELDKAYKNYENWKRLLEVKRKEAKLQYTR